MTVLEQEIKAFIIETLNLEDLTVDDIDSEETLFIDGLGLDSIDALELGVAIQKKYGVRVDANNEDIKQHFATVRNLAKFVESGRQGA